jgi:simple sugar transport system permease protein
MLIAAILVGAIWGGLPAVCKAIWGTNETLFTLMMNYVATGLVSYFLLLWTPSGSSVLGMLDKGHLPILGHEYLITIIISLLMTAFVYIYLKYSKQGYEISVVGESQRTARYVGIKVEWVIIRTMLLSGAICGIAGMLLTAGTNHTLTTTLVDGRGFTAVMVSWLAKFNPIFMILTSLLLVFLDRGAGDISSKFGLNQSFSDIITGIILFFIIGSEFFITYQIHVTKRTGKEERLNV